MSDVCGVTRAGFGASGGSYRLSVMSELAADLVERLAVRHHAPAAFRELLALGASALPTVRVGLSHPDTSVRYHCARFLDHYLAPEQLGDLLAMLDDPAAGVRVAALHSLACDQCKEGEKPDRAKVLPDALRILADDPDAHVRAIAIEVVGRLAHESDAAREALQTAISRDPSSAVRKKARWYAPGGPIFNRTRPKTRRTR
jgi:HEAT repeat protein